MENRKTILLFAVLSGLIAAAGTLFLIQNQPPGLRSGPGIYIIAGAIVGIGVLVVLIKLCIRESKRRKQAWLEKAEALEDIIELDFDHEPPRDFHREFTFLPEIGKSGKTNRLARGSIADREALFFERSYTQSTGQSTVTIYHCVYSAEAPNWPELSVTPRNPFSKFLRTLGRRKGLLLDDPDFNHAFVVKCEDEPFAVTLLTPEMQRFMLGNTATIWRITHNRVFLIYKGQLKLDRMPTSVDRLKRFWSFVPKEVEAWERRGLV